VKLLWSLHLLELSLLPSVKNASRC
jgi:hypothetical protein